MIKKWKKLPNSVKSSIAFVISSLFIKGVAFFVTPIFTRIMDINEYGIVTAYNSWVSIIEIFAILGLTSAGVFNVGLNENENNRGEFISSCLGLCNLSTFICFAFILCFKIFINDNFILDNNLLLVMFVHFLFSPAQIFWITRQRYEYKYKMATIVTILSVLFSQILSIIFVLYFKGSTSLLKILGNEIGTLLFAIPIYIILLKNGNDYLNIRVWKKVLLLAIPLIPHYLSQHVMASSDKIMLKQYVNSSSVAIYGIVSNISMIGIIFWNAINASLVPYSFDKIKKKDYESIRNISKKLLLVYFLILVFIMLLAPEILSLLAPKKYYNGIYCVPPLVSVIFLQAIYNLFANIEFYFKKTSSIAISTVVAAFINIILNYLLIPKYGYIAASYTTLISNIFLVLFHYIGYKGNLTNNIYDIKFIFLLAIIFLIFSFICNILYLNLLARIFFLLLVIIIMIIYRIKIYAIINDVRSEK